MRALLRDEGILNDASSPFKCVIKYVYRGAQFMMKNAKEGLLVS